MSILDSIRGLKIIQISSLDFGHFGQPIHKKLQEGLPRGNFAKVAHRAMLIQPLRIICPVSESNRYGGLCFSGMMMKEETKRNPRQKFVCYEDVDGRKTLGYVVM